MRTLVLDGDGRPMPDGYPFTVGTLLPCRTWLAPDGHGGWVLVAQLDPTRPSQWSGAIHEAVTS